MTPALSAPAPVVLITGAARRIGARTSTLFHQQGYRIVIHCHHSLREAEALAAMLNQQRADSACVLHADLCQFDQLPALADQALAAYGRMDVLVNNASAFYPTRLESLTLTQWQDLMGSNAQAALFLCQQLSPALRSSQGSIVNLTDMNSDRGMAGFSAYTMAKAALQAMTRSLARELAPDVRVNAVSPGAILWPAHASDAELHAAERARILAGIPLGRLGSEDDIAQAVLFLAQRAHYMTGQTLRVDGGRALC